MTCHRLRCGQWSIFADATEALRTDPDLFFNQGDDNMTGSRKFAFLGMALCAFALPASAQSVTHLESPNPGAVIDSAVVVPPGYTTYYISGTPAGPKDPNAPAGSPGRWGDTTQQTDDSLNKLEAILTKLGLTFGDVVKATVFMAGDPARGGEIDFPAMNKEWGKRFGTSAQPNKPARSTIKIGLATPGALVEIEMIAVKKVK
jgi:enamine deaminase RidA (YjgF/YER057c/UK114 family)